MLNSVAHIFRDEYLKAAERQVMCEQTSMGLVVGEGTGRKTEWVAWGGRHVRADI